MFTDGVDVISGITEITILGYNFGTTVSDVLSITIRGQDCSSIQLLSSSKVKCRLSSKQTEDYVLPPEAMGVQKTDGVKTVTAVDGSMPLKPSDVTLICTTGRL